MFRTDYRDGHEMLARLIHPVTPERFFDEYWQRRILHVRRDEPHYYDDLLTVDGIDRLLSGTPLPSALVNLVREGTSLPHYTFSDESGHVVPREVLHHHRAGYTVIARAMHRWLPTLHELCTTARSYFVCNTQANLYLTPERSESSTPHWDSHDLFVVQLAGAKRWVLHDHALENPLPSRKFDRERHTMGERTGEIVLRAGDVAYLPRGTGHNPASLGYSVHIAVGVLVKTWADVVTRAVELAVTEDAELREVLPLDRAAGRYELAGDMERRVKLLAERMLDPTRVQEMTDKLSLLPSTGADTDTRGMFTAAADGVPVELDTPVTVPGPPTSLIPAPGGAVTVTMNGTSLRLGPTLAAGAAHLVAHRHARVRDVPAADDATRIALVEHLVAQGCVRVGGGPEV